MISRARSCDVLGAQVTHQPVAVVDDHLARAVRERRLDGGIGLAGHEGAAAVVVGAVEAVAAEHDLVRMRHPGQALHVDGDVDPHRLSRRSGAGVYTYIRR